MKTARSFVGGAKRLVRWIADLGEATRSKRSEYGIASGYRHRRHTRYFDDTGLTDEWQKEVYSAAANIMRTEGLRTVYDVGCGSGYKLINYLGEYDTTGFDIEPTLTFLKQKYPDRKWRSAPFDDRSLTPADLVICSDVIEHVPDPDALLDFLRHVTGGYLVLSTPDRDLVYGKWHPRRRGPARNPTHVREWSFQEFRGFIASKFDIIEHRLTNRAQSTQMVVCGNEASQAHISARPSVG